MDVERWRELKQPWLPFDFLEEEKKEPEIKLPHYEKPKSDNQKLLEYQYQYKNGDKEALAKFYELSYTICLKIIRCMAKTNPHVRRLSLEDKQIKARDAASYLPEQFLKKPGFYIKKNAPGYLYLRVERELFHRRKCDEIVDFVDIAAFFKEGELDEEIEGDPKWTT